MKGRLLLPLLLCVTVSTGLFAQVSHNGADEGRDDTPAERYCLWARQAIDEGRWADALAVLERASDYADKSSDISFLLARVLAHEGKNRRAVLDAFERAIAAGLWVHYTETEARLMEAEQLVALRNYSGALALLAGAGESADATVLRLTALKGLLRNSAAGTDANETPALRGAEFRQKTLEAMDRYPRDPRPLRIFFDYAAERMPTDEEDSFNAVRPGGAADRSLMELALKRLPYLLETDPHLAWRAAPFIRDTGEAFRLIAAYRTGSLTQNAGDHFTPEPVSIAAALNLGVISDERAVEELFGRYPDAGIPEILPLPVTPRAQAVLDRDLIVKVSGLLRAERGRNFFAEKLIAFSGVITADDDADGYPESSVLYSDGMPTEYSRDEDQDGITDLLVSFSGGRPQWARLPLPPDSGAGENSPALIHWENYPSVLRAELNGAVYIPRPGEFQFAPLEFAELPDSVNYAGLLYPRRKPDAPRLNRRTLVLYSLQIQRPSAEFQGALEWTKLEQGIPRRSCEILNGLVVSVTEYEQGIPVLQRADLDFDSRMETARRFRAAVSPDEVPPDYRKLLEVSESDWNGDGLYEYAELYRPDGSVVYSWDMDGDGVREYSETRNGNQNNETE